MCFMCDTASPISDKENKHMADSIGKRIRAARRRSGISQAELARRIQISAQWMWTIEQGQVEPRASHVAAIARVLGCSGDYLLGLTDDEEDDHGTTTTAIPRTLESV